MDEDKMDVEQEAKYNPYDDLLVFLFFFFFCFYFCFYFVKLANTNILLNN
jgi:hypothetical protein